MADFSHKNYVMLKKAYEKAHRDSEAVALVITVDSENKIRLTNAEFISEQETILLLDECKKFLLTKNNSIVKA